MKQISSGLILLLFVLLSAYLCEIVAAKRCDSNRGYKSKECNEDEFCCETNGKVECCTASELWWVWTLLAVSLGILIPLVIVAVALCFCLCYSHKRRRSSQVAQPVASIESLSSSETVRMDSLKQPCRSTDGLINTDAPPSYSDISKYLPKSPPPYPGT